MDVPRPRRPWDRTPVREREYFDLYGPGLVAVLPPRRPQESESGEWQPPTGGAWVHIGGDGRIRAFSGKAEVGQGTRLALALLVAEELKVAPEQVELRMADTDLCPWDMGTFGSRSMPDAGPALATAAAGARGALVTLAAERTGIPRDRLEARDGEVRSVGELRGIPYADLVRKERRIELVSPDTPRTAPSRWERAGRPTTDPQGEDVVTGRRKYVSDLRLPGTLEGVLLHPPVYGARLRTIDTTPATARDGVTVVRDGEFVAVAAPTLGEARAALRAIHVDWEGGASVAEPEIEAHLRAHPDTGESWDREERVVGDVDAALANASVRMSATYRAPYIAHVPLETRCALAQWDGERVTVWVGTQTPFPVRNEVAEALGVPIEAVRVVVPPTGSGFGGKHGGEVAVAAARLSRAARRPVRVAFGREEEFRHAYFRPMAIVDVRAGLGADGRLTAWSFHNINAGSAALLPPYRIPNQRVDNELSESPLPQGSYRALAATTNNFARESAIDELCATTGADPLAFREANLEDERLRAVLSLAGSRAGWAMRRRRPGKGFGLAVGLEKGSRVATVAEVTVEPDRRLGVDRLLTVFEAGAVVNPDNLRSQVEGATLMALGGALFEAVHFDHGAVTNPRLSEYRVPRFSDLPELEVEIVDRRDLPPAGAGETPLIAVAPALANAIYDATGRRLRALPLAPEGRVPTGPAGAPAVGPPR
jgi:nicotinate dehydrogenase subunit B